MARRGSFPLGYIVQPAGSRADAMAAALSQGQQDLTEHLNSRLSRGGTPFQVVVVDVTAGVPSQVGLSTMPAEGVLVEELVHSSMKLEDDLQSIPVIASVGLGVFAIVLGAAAAAYS